GHTACASVTWALARLVMRTGLLDDAVGMYSERGKQDAKTVVRDGKTGAEFFNDLITDKRFLPYLEPPTVTWNFPKLKSTEAAAGGVSAARMNVMDVPVCPDALPVFRRHRLVIDMQGRGAQGWGAR